MRRVERGVKVSRGVGRESCCEQEREVERNVRSAVSPEEVTEGRWSTRKGREETSGEQEGG